MKHLIWKLVLPLAIISFAAITKWWYTLPVDGQHTVYNGFPLPFAGPGWHTSLSLQIFVAELFFDFFIYFVCWVIIISCFNKYWIKVGPNKLLVAGLWTISGLILCAAGVVAGNADNIFYLTRPYDMEVIKTGWKFVWQ